MISKPKPVTGRQSAYRAEHSEAYCQGCRARLTIGEPKPNDTWTSLLTLTTRQRDLLLMAAAEYEDLSEDAGHISNAVEYIDWISPDVVKAA